MSGRRGRIALFTLLTILAAVGVYLVGNGSVALWDRDEPRYAQASRQMVQSGDWVVPHYLAELRTKKPPLIYWCQAAAMTVLGDNEFAARLPSVIAAALVLGIIGVTISRFVGPRRAFWTVLVLATSLMMILTAKVCLTDAVLLLWIVIGQLCLYAIYRGRTSWPIIVAFWLAAGLGALTKGTNLAIHLGTLIALAGFDVGRDWRSAKAWLAAITWWRRLRPLAGLLIFAAVVTPWVALVAHREKEFLPAMFGNVSKHAASSAEGHAAPPGYYLVSVWIFFLPWSILLPLALVTGWQRRRLPPIRFALAAVIGPWVFVEIVLSKLPHYLLPAYPALAFLVADVIVRSLRSSPRHLPGENHLRQPGFVRGIGVWALIITLLGAAPILALRGFADAPRFATVLFAAVALLYAATVFALFRARRPAAGLATMGGGMMALCAVAFGLYLPRAQYLRTSVRVADTLRRHDATGPGEVIMLDYKEPSLAFYEGGTIRENPNLVLTDKLLQSAPPWMVITRDVWQSPRTEEAARRKLEVVQSVRGLDIAEGMRSVEVMVVRRRDGGQAAVSPPQTGTAANRIGG
jgi:4-amino-4-deoxy-L-arabinose transferase-like glycosyltransferase